MEGIPLGISLGTCCRGLARFALTTDCEGAHVITALT